jgi:hypothetical protein
MSWDVYLITNHVYYIITVMSTVELTSSIDKSGRLAVCHNETIMYRCQTQGVLTWNIGILPDKPTVFAANESDHPRFYDVDGKYFTFLHAMDNYLTSYLVIPYNLEWNGTVVQCMSGSVSVSKDYVVTGRLML